MSLCTLAQLKSRLGISDSDSDTLLGEIITGVSAQLQGQGGCGRQLALDSGRVEYINVAEQRMASIWVDRYPIASITEVKEALYEQFDDADALTVNESYQFNPDTGELRRIGWWLYGMRTVKVTYDGGYVLPDDVAGEGETELPAEIVEAAIEQASFVYQRRDSLGLTSVGSQGGSASAYAQDKLLPGVAETMKGFRRYA